MTTVLISGANRGIGLELARQYAAAGATVIAGVRDPERADALKRVEGVQVHALDVGQDASVKAFRDEVGDRPIDILIANAGVSGERQQPGDFDFDGWLRVFDVNSLGPARLAEAFRANLKAGRGKKLAAISSTLGSTAAHAGDLFDYRASKAALNNIWAGLAKAFAADGIVCLPLHPGWVKTDMGGAGATVSPEQSVKGLRAVIDAATLQTSGQLKTFEGEPLPW